MTTQSTESEEKFNEHVAEMIRLEGKLHAVQWYKEKKQCELYEAKRAIDEIAAKNKLTTGGGKGCSLTVLIVIGITLGALFLL